MGGRGGAPRRRATTQEVPTAYKGRYLGSAATATERFEESRKHAVTHQREGAPTPSATFVLPLTDRQVGDAWAAAKL